MSKPSDHAAASQPPSQPALEATTAPTSLGEASELDVTDGPAAPAGERTEAHAPTEALGATEPPAGEQPAATPAKAPAQKISVLGDYRMVRRLGTGGMGSVYLARQISLDRDVALKVMSKELAGQSSFVDRFYREARLMARLEHPNIVRCHGVGQDKGWHFLAMEFVDGGSLTYWLDKEGQLSVGDTLHVILACADALQHAHDNHLIHRDVKPDNVLISSKGVVKVADLGLAKALDEDLSMTKTGTGAGTPLYMAPEQARDMKHVDHRCDIYALGIMLYRCLTGKMPYEGETLIEVIEAKEKGKFTPARRVNSDVPERLDLIVDKMVAPRPEHRYQSCAEVIRDLSAFGLAHETLSFINPGSEPSVAPVPTRRGLPSSAPRPGPLAPPRGVVKKPAAAPPPRIPAQQSEAVEASDIWYVTFTTSEGRVVTQKLTTGQVIGLIRSPHFDVNAQASKTYSGGYRDLGTYPEFAQIARSRSAKSAADRKTTTFRNLYEQIDKDQQKRQSRRWLRSVFAGVSTWVSILIVLALLGGGGFLIFLLVKFLTQWLGGKVESMSGPE